ncbi:hypothetical protein SLEP1_g48515 [Rubroshorea leprosula]|uniref:AMP-activated protein kinase glycogen-binding domain-containing protein n=1 Tax=Rubroshorea leprosula TaxID=152421 RepID=A0AAV5LU14_9ROSI|nr:hypothetical protein SLEP1_g48515 [Rubroshorea leprosula]
MATLFHPPTMLSLSVHRLLFSSGQQQQRPSWRTQECPPGRKFILCASSAKKPRRSRKIKSDEELCNEVREFVSVVGLPEGHVPSMKEFSKHGRNDLANLVRRRGYKLMKELLASSTVADLDEFVGEKSLVENHCMTGNLEEILTGQNEKASNAVQDFSLSAEVISVENLTLVDDFSTANHNSMKESTAYSFEDQNEKSQIMVDNLFPSTNGSIQRNYLGSLTSGLNLESSDHDCRPTESLGISTLEKKVSEFIQNGDLDKIEDSVFGVSNASGDEVSKAVTKMESEQLKSYNLEELNLESIRGGDEIEIDRLRFMLQQKELEMSRLKEQIEKEKIALSALQTKAETEIKKAQELVSQKDAELHAAEESLAGLKEVQIEYSGEGEIVEVAGSFNGWHHQVKMDPHPSSCVIDPIRSRKSKIWSTVLWLYPGTYEV